MKLRPSIILSMLFIMQSVLAWDGSGTNESPWLIRTISDWEQIDVDLKNGSDFSGKVFRLDNDLSVYSFIGSSESHPFTGIFDGDGYTLTIDIESEEDAVGPFAAIKGATIRNLHVNGLLKAGVCSGGIVGKVYGTGNVVENCRMSASLGLKGNSSNGPHGGGIVGHGLSSGLTIKGCLYDGSLHAQTYNDSFMGTILGWCDSADGITISDCMSAGTYYSKNLSISYNVLGNPQAVKTTNSYYIWNAKELTGQKKALKVTTSKAFTLDFGTPSSNYTMSGIKSYPTGMEYNGIFYASEGENVNLNVIVNDGYSLSESPTVNNGTLTANGATYTLTMGNENAFIDGNITSTASFKGSGTNTDPWLLSSDSDWYLLSQKVSEGNTFEGQVLRMTNDIDACGVMVGDSKHPFKGTFDGNGHKLTFNVGGGIPTEYINGHCAPFQRIEGAYILHLKTLGKIYTSHQNAGGIVSIVAGNSPSQLYDCSSSISIQSDNSLISAAYHGGLIGSVESGGCSLEECIFTGIFEGYSDRCAGLVGNTTVPISLKRCLFDPEIVRSMNDCSTLVGSNNNSSITFNDCYCTTYFGNHQGTCVFNKLVLPKGCTYELEGDPTVSIGGNDYWENGAYVHMTAPNSVNFGYWRGNCFLSDPFNRDGRHQILDLANKPIFTIDSSIPEPVDEERMWGVFYRYLSRADYHLYISDEECLKRSWYFNDAGRLCVADESGTEYYITAAVGYKADELNITLRGVLWFTKEYQGGVLVNDLVSTGWHHTHLGVIAPRAFKGCTELRNLTFSSDRDATIFAYNDLSMALKVGDEAFDNCPNLKEITMMYYSYKGNDHWEVLSPECMTLADDAFNNSKNCVILVDPTQYLSYTNSEAWKSHVHRFRLYMYTKDDFCLHGVNYSYMRDSSAEAVKNDAAGHEVMMNTLKYWNANYQNFNAEDLLAPQDEHNIWYAQVVGVDDKYLDDPDVRGVLRIYNDPGSQYNYKTVAIKSGAFKDNKKLKAVEFYQTNGLSDNSYTDIKMVIENGAFAGCSNLHELRMFYYVEDGPDRWDVLGPEDVIPGNNIFGLPSAEEIEQMTHEELVNRNRIPDDFHIIVYTERYKDFLEDPNWAPYIGYIEPVDHLTVEELRWDDPGFEISDHKGIYYGYMVNPGGIRQSSTTVSQDFSWWSAARIGVEALIHILGIGYTTWVWEIAKTGYTDGQLAAALSDLGGSLIFSMRSFDATMATLQIDELSVKTCMVELANATTNSDGHKNAVTKAISTFIDSDFGKKDNFKKLPNNLRLPLINKGLIDTNGKWKFTKAELATFLSDESNMAWMERIFVDVLRYFCTIISADISLQESQLAATQRSLRSLLSKSASNLSKQDVWNAMPYINQKANNAAYFSSTTWGGKNNYDSDALKKGVRDNILSNIHQVGMLAGSYILTTPTKNLSFHTYVKTVADSVTHAVIHAGTDKGQGINCNTRTITFDKYAFRNKKNLQYVSFFENNVSTNEAVPMVLTIPDSAFVGCDNLKEFSLLLKTEDNGTQILGPENFILAGDNIFAGLSPDRFQIVIDPSRKEDFLNSESWAPLKEYFSYREAKPKTQYTEYGCNYAYAYDYGSVQRVHKVEGHKIEHTVVTGSDWDFLNKHKGAIKLCNDIGVFNNYQLDAVYRGAFRNDLNLRRVLFTDLYGSTGFGDVYTNLCVNLEDSCFAGCKNLNSIDLVYLVTDGKNHFTPMTPEMIKIGNGVLDGTTAFLKMMPQQVEWFMADSTWVKYSDRFMPCIIHPTDEGVKATFKFLNFTDDAATKTDDTEWDGYIDLSRLPKTWDGYDYKEFDGLFVKHKNDLISFPDFKQFEALGLETVRESWFEGCNYLNNIQFPSTTKTIERKAFKGCSALTEIDIPEKVESINNEAFSGCSNLHIIHVHKATPFTLFGNPFPFNDGMRIYVPDASLQAYKKAWGKYAKYIYSEKENPLINNVVVVEAPGQLASRLGLSPVKSYSKIISLVGPYTQYDSLTVVGPLNGEDLSVLRHMAGANAYDSDPTDGRLSYLNLWNADIRKDNSNSYNGNGIDEYVDADNKVPDYLFENCTALHTIILPKSATYIGENIFEDASGLRRVAVGLNTTEYECDILQNLEGISELVFITNKHASSSYKDPWEAEIGQAYVPYSQLGDYLGDGNLTRRAHSVISMFEDDAVMKALAKKGLFFPDEYVTKANVDSIFTGNTDIVTFNDFNRFQNLKVLGNTFENCSSMRSISLPLYLEEISKDAFAGCTRLDTIYVKCDTVPELAHDAFRNLPSDFSIIVPKTLCKLYRSKWEQYADHINPDNSYYSGDDIIVVRTTAPNTLAEKLGLTTTASAGIDSFWPWITSVSGDYSKIKKIKIVGPISALDFDVMRYLAGYCPWIQSPNYAGTLEYIDLYDAEIVETETHLRGELSSFLAHGFRPITVEEDCLPYHAFLKAYNLKTVILPKTCTEVESRAFQECSSLEVLVIGDDMKDFNWNSLDDDVSLVRMYILANKVVSVNHEFFAWRWLCNNYNPTFDSFYVRPSLLKEYLSDTDHMGSWWQHSNKVQTGLFKEDESFCAFAAHAAATEDDLSTVYDVNGWFDDHTDITDLTPLGFTAIDTLRADDVKQLTDLEKIVLPTTLNYIEKDALNQNSLRYVDMMMCPPNLIEDKKGGIRDYLGLNPYALAYVPSSYGETDETNVVWSTGSGYLYNNYYLLSDSRDYEVPYTFTTKHVDNNRVLMPREGSSSNKYTVFLPYGLPIPNGAKGYKLSKSEGTTLVFDQVDELEPLKPYLLVTGNLNVSLATDREQQIPTSVQANSSVGQSQIDVVNYSMRGTFSEIDNETATDIGAYILQYDNKWHLVKDHPNSNIVPSIPAFRAYLLKNGIPGANSLSMELVDNTDGVENILTIDHDGTKRWYDLNGRELPAKPDHGIYIYNGKKHVAK